MMGTYQDPDKVKISEYVQKLQERMGACFEQVRMHLKQYWERQRKYYNLASHGMEYQPGDPVYLMEKNKFAGSQVERSIHSG